MSAPTALTPLNCRFVPKLNQQMVQCRSSTMPRTDVTVVIRHVAEIAGLLDAQMKLSA